MRKEKSITSEYLIGVFYYYLMYSVVGATLKHWIKKTKIREEVSERNWAEMLE